MTNYDTHKEDSVVTKVKEGKDYFIISLTDSGCFNLEKNTMLFQK